MGTYDVIVVGAGPAGSVCAHDCSRLGLDTLILERETFPRDKPCGGALKKDILSKYPGLEASVSRRTTMTRTFLNYEPIMEHENKEVMVLRSTFDEHLARRASKAGADLREDHRVVDIEVDGSGVTVACEGGEAFRGRMVVDASGAKGPFFPEHKARMKERLDYKVVSMVFETSCPNEVIDERMGNVPEKGASYYNAYLMTGFIGYGWVFPKDGMLNVGLGTVTTHSHDLKNQFLKFLKRSGFDDLDRSGMMAGLIPVALLPQLWLPRVLFVGDAGGFVNAITGGGIMYGMCSGENAAIIAKEAVEADDFSGTTLSKYEDTCAEIKKELNFRTMALYYLAGAVKRGLDRPTAVRLLLRTLLPRFD